jgi:hypothetical protein
MTGLSVAGERTADDPLWHGRVGLICATLVSAWIYAVTLAGNPAPLWLAILTAPALATIAWRCFVSDP